MSTDCLLVCLRNKGSEHQACEHYGAIVRVPSNLNLIGLVHWLTIVCPWKMTDPKIKIKIAIYLIWREKRG